jgi:hypothetical protein
MAIENPVVRDVLSTRIRRREALGLKVDSKTDGEKSYTFDIQLTGYEQVTVSASNLEQAEEKASDKFWLIYDTAPAQTLRTKSIELQLLGEN